MGAHKEDRFLRGRQIAFLDGQGDGFPRQVRNRRRRSRESPEPACAQTLLAIWGGTHRGGRMNRCRGAVQSAWKKLRLRRKGDTQRSPN